MSVTSTIQPASILKSKTIMSMSIFRHKTCVVFLFYYFRDCCCIKHWIILLFCFKWHLLCHHFQLVWWALLRCPTFCHIWKVLHDNDLQKNCAGRFLAFIFFLRFNFTLICLSIYSCKVICLKKTFPLKFILDGDKSKKLFNLDIHVFG